MGSRLLFHWRENGRDYRVFRGSESVIIGICNHFAIIIHGSVTPIIPNKSNLFNHFVMIFRIYNLQVIIKINRKEHIFDLELIIMKP